MINLTESEPKTLNTVNLLSIVEAAKTAEISRDRKAALAAFLPIWENPDNEPDFSDVEPLPIRAELYRLAGFFLHFSGKAESIKNYQERAKDLIGKAINLFRDLNLTEKADEAYINLAIVYWHSGDSENCDAILRQIEEDYADNPFESPYLRVKVTRAISLWAKEQYDEALEMLESLNDKMKLSTDTSLKLSFHNKAGVIYLAKEKYDQAIIHFRRAIKCASDLKNSPMIALQYNNLSIVYRELAVNDSRYFADAFENIDKALGIFERLNALGWYAIALETRAGILLRIGEKKNALEAIDRSIEVMRTGDDYGVLVDALIVRFEIYVKMGNYIAALRDFSEAAELARLHIGDYKVELLNQKIADLVYFREKASLTVETHHFRKHLVRNALIKNKFQRENTAKMLGITRGGLYDILEDQFPELYNELNIPKRDWSPTGRKGIRKTESSPLKLVGAKTTTRVPDIQKLTVSFSQLVFPGKEDAQASKIAVFYVPEEQSEDFSMDGAVIVLCNASVEIQGQCLVIAQQNNTKIYELVLGSRNDLKKSVHLQDIETERNLDASEYKIFGKIIAFCPLNESSGEIIVFRGFKY